MVLRGDDKKLKIVFDFFGIDPKKTKSATIHMPCDDVVTVDLVQYVYIDEKNTGELEKCRYTLTEFPKEEDV